MSERKIQALENYAPTVSSAIANGPFAVIGKLVPNLSEDFFRLRADLIEVGDYFAEGSREGEKRQRSALDALDRIQFQMVQFEAAARSVCVDLVENCEEWIEELRQRTVEANCDCASAEDKVSKLQDRVRSLELLRESRLQEHNPASPDLRAKVLALTGGKCAYCDAGITPDCGDGKPNFVVEHVVPKSCGGPDHFTNYVPACSKCNYQKSTNHVLEFIQRRLVGTRVETAEAAE